MNKQGRSDLQHQTSKRLLEQSKSNQTQIKHSKIAGQKEEGNIQKNIIIILLDKSA